MTTIQIAQHVVGNGCVLMRPRKNSPHEWDMKPVSHSGNKRGWFYMDTQTANMLITVYNALGEANQAKFNRIPLMRLVAFGWKQIKVTA